MLKNLAWFDQWRAAKAQTELVKMVDRFWRLFSSLLITPQNLSSCLIFHIFILVRVTWGGLEPIPGTLWDTSPLHMHICVRACTHTHTRAHTLIDANFSITSWLSCFWTVSGNPRTHRKPMQTWGRKTCHSNLSSGSNSGPCSCETAMLVTVSPYSPVLLFP